MKQFKTSKRLWAILLLCLFPTMGKAQIKLTKLQTTELPSDIKFEGKIKNAVKWKDNLGDNIVITSETGKYPSKGNESEDDFLDAELFAFHFLILKNNSKQTWKVHDFIKDCPVDIEASFIKNTFQITDLNKDGIAEIWLMYKTACHGDVSPCDMKIIMYQGNQKYAMRGQNKVKVSEKEFDGGNYKFDQAFTNGPTEFLDFAKKMWNKNIMQVWGE